MTVTRRSFNAVMNSAGTNTDNITVGLADIAEGDLLLAVTSAPTGTPSINDTGWVLLGEFTSSTLQQSNLYRKIATDSEPANYTFTFTQSGTVGVALIGFVGAHDVLSWDAQVQTADSTPSSRRMDAARDAVAYSVCCYRDGATTGMSVNQGAEEFDVISNNSGATIFRGITAAYYGPGIGGLTDIVNIGDALPGTTWTSSGGALDHAISWAILIDNKAPDTEEWSSTNGDFGVELKLDTVELDSLGGIATRFRGDVTGEVTAFTESGENAPNEVTENLADGLTSTKWLTFGDTGWVQYDFGSGNAKTIKRYRLTSANDSQDRDPMDWTLQGSNNGTDFDVLDTRTNQAFAARFETNEFKVMSPGEYRYYRLDITSNLNPTPATSIQLAEFRLSTHDVWEDITSFVNEESKIRITRGLQGSSGRSDFTRAYVELNNTDGRFSTRNQSGAFFGSLQRNNQMRISKAYGTKSLQLQGDVQLEGTNMCGDAARCPLTDALQITGDIDVRIDLELESWRDEQMLCGIASAQSDPLDPKASWSLHIDNNGQLNWLHSPGSGTVSYVSTVAVPQATRQALRVTVDVDNGSSGSTATFYTADTIAGPWTRLGDPVTIDTGTTSLGYTGGALVVGHITGKDERGLHGLVYHFEVYNGIGGTAVTDVDFTALTNGAHTWTDSDDNIWITVNNAVVSNRRYRFHGEVAEWPLAWDPTGTWITCSATGAGVQKRMERSNNPLSVMRRYHTKGIIEDPGAFERFATPYAYWPLEDKKGTFQIASGLPSKPGMQIYGTPLFEETDGDAFNESDQLIKLNGAKFGGKVNNNPSGYADIRWIQYSPTGMSDGAEVLEFYATGSLIRFLLSYVSDNTWRLRGFDEDDTGTPFWDSGNQTITTEGELMHLQLILDQDGTGIDVTMNAYDVYGESLGSWTDTFLVSTLGRIHRININPDGDISNSYIGHVALYGVDSPPFLGTQIGAHHYETAGERIKRLCDEEQIDFRYIGALTDTAFMGYQTHDNPFAMMSSAAVSDGGYLVDPLDAFGLEYRTLRSLLNQAAHLTLDYDAGELSGELRPVEDDSYIVNDFTANRGGAGGARFQRTDGSLSIDLPPDGVGPYEQSQSYSLAHEGQCADIASWEVHKGTLDEERFTRIELALENLRLAADSALTERILLLDVGDRVDITDTPDFLVAEDIRQVVIGYEEWFDNFQHNFKLNTIPERIFEIAEYDSWRSFDNDESTLYQDIDSTETVITTLVETGRKWTEDLRAMPFDIRVDGEVMRVVAPGELVNANPFFDDGTTGWTAGGTSTTIAASTAVLHPHPDAVNSLLVTPGGVSAFANVQSSTSEGIAVVEQNTYKASGWIYNPGGYSAASAFINWRDSGGSLVSTTTGTSTALAAGEWTYLTAEGVAPDTAVTAHPGLQETGTPAASDEFYVWAIRAVEEVSAGDESWSGDSFNRADSTTTMGDTDGDGTVATWVENSGTWGIISNTAYITASADSVTTIGGAADLELLQVEVPTWASGVANLVFRFTDTSNYLRFGGTVGSAAILEQVVAGAATTINTTDDDQGLFTLAAGDTLAVRCNGSVIECFVNGVLACCVSDTTQQSATRVGLRTSVNTTRFDNFYVEATASTQPLTVERGRNGAAAIHKANAEVALYNTPRRGI